MLVKTQSERIVEYWDMIRHAVIKGMPNLSPRIDVDKVANNILEAAMKGIADIWMLGSEGKLYAIASTVQTIDMIGGSNALVIYSLFGYRDMPKELWADAISTLEKYARAKGCLNISAFTDVPAVVNIAKGLGFNMVNFLTKEV